MSDRNIKGIRALVTGATSGIGKAIAQAIAQRGGNVLATARRSERLIELAASSDGRIQWEAGDQTDATFREHLIASLNTRLGGLDLLVLAAGVGGIGRFETSPKESLESMLAIDLVAPAELARNAIATLRVGNRPGIVFIGSILGYQGVPLHAEYCAAKFALRGLANSIRLELQEDSIDVMLVSPGPTQSEFWNRLLHGSRPHWSRGLPMEASQVAEAVLRGLVKGQREVIPGFSNRWFVRASILFPRLLDRFIQKVSQS